MFCHVVYWRKKHLPLFLVKSFEQVHKAGSFTQGEWVEVTAPIFFKLKKFFEKERFKHRLYFNYRKSSIDLTLSAMQRIVMDYERVYHFYKLIEYWENRQEDNFKVSIVDFNVRASLDLLGIGVNKKNRHFIFKINRFLDRQGRTIKNILVLFQFFVRIIKNLLGFNKCKNLNSSENVKIFWYCLSFNEIASCEGSFDTTTLVRRKLISNEESLYVLPTVPDEGQINWLHKNKINWVVRQNILDSLPIVKQIKVFLFLLEMVIFPWNWKGADVLKHATLKQSFIQDIPLLDYFMHINAKILLTGQANGLYESPIVSLARGLGRKTVWWSYAAVGSKHIPNKLPYEYCNEQVEESITLSEEKWIWFDIDKLMLNKRSLNLAQEDQTKFVKLGPVMSGDSSWLQKVPYQARRDYGFQGNPECKIWITIFDLPVAAKHWHDEHRWPVGPVSKEMQFDFFRDISRLLDQFPEVGIIYKPKRPFPGKNRYKHKNKALFYSERFLDFISEKNKYAVSRKLINLSNNVDPYIPIALGDHSIAMPYTSALLAFLSTERAGIYYDATSRVNQTYPSEIDEITVGGYNDLCKTVQKWLDGSVDTPKPIKDLLRYEGDPGNNFSDHLKQLL